MRLNYIVKAALTAGLIGFTGLSSLAVEISFQEGDLRNGTNLVSASYVTGDAYIRDSAPTGNANSTYIYGGTTTSDSRRMLFGFDLSYLNTLIGTNYYEINSVEFRMTKFNANLGGTTTFDTHLIGAFDEATATWENNNSYGSTLSGLSVDTGASEGTVYSFAGSAWIDAVTNALNDASETLYFMGKRRSEVVSVSTSYAVIVDSSESGSVDERPELVVNITVYDPERIIAAYDFENHTAGALLPGPVGTARVDDGTKGDGPAFNYSQIMSNCTVSTLDTVASNALNRTGCNVREDTIVGSVPGGQFLELSAASVGTAIDEMIPNDPSGGTENALFFSVTPDAGYQMDLTGLVWDMGLGRGSLDTGTVTFNVQGWYSLDAGASWVQMHDKVSVNNTEAQSFSGFTMQTISLAVSGQTNTVLIALAVGDNSGRSAYVANSVSPAAHYLDNITLYGTVEEAVVVVPPTPEAVQYETIEWDNDMSVDPVGDVGNEWADRLTNSTYTMGGGVLTMAAGSFTTVIDATPYNEFLGATTIDLVWRATSDDTDASGRGAGLWCNVSGDPDMYGSIHFDSVLSAGSQTFKIFIDGTNSIVSIPGFGVGMLTLHAVIDSDALTISYEVTDGVTTESGSTGYTESATSSGLDKALTLFTAAPSAEIDLVRVVRIGNTYASWASDNNLTGSDTNMSADVDSDGLDNLMEYALGGNPTNDDYAAIAPVSYTAVDDGTNWFYHVHNERTDDGTLTYTLGTETNLVDATSWNTNDIVVTSEEQLTANMKAITSRTEASDDAKFIKLSVEK